MTKLLPRATMSWGVTAGTRWPQGAKPHVFPSGDTAGFIVCSKIHARPKEGAASILEIQFLICLLAYQWTAVCYFPII